MGGFVAYSGGTVGELHPIILFSLCGALAPDRPRSPYLIVKDSVAQNQIKCNKKGGSFEQPQGT